MTVPITTKSPRCSRAGQKRCFAGGSRRVMMYAVGSSTLVAIISRKKHSTAGSVPACGDSGGDAGAVWTRISRAATSCGVRVRRLTHLDRGLGEDGVAREERKTQHKYGDGGRLLQHARSRSRHSVGGVPV